MSESNQDPSQLIVFKGKNIRRAFHHNEWWFSVVDIIDALTERSNPRRYWSDLKIQIKEKEGFYELYEKIVQLKLQASDGKFYETDCANTEIMV
jgi:prophage antirepressor-like protein